MVEFLRVSAVGASIRGSHEEALLSSVFFKLQNDRNGRTFPAVIYIS